MEYALIGRLCDRRPRPSACGHSWTELAPHIEEFSLEGIVVKVLGLEGLLLTKEGLRDRDGADRGVLLAALERLKAAGGIPMVTATSIDANYCTIDSWNAVGATRSSASPATT